MSRKRDTVNGKWESSKETNALMHGNRGVQALGAAGYMYYGAGLGVPGVVYLGHAGLVLTCMTDWY